MNTKLSFGSSSMFRLKVSFMSLKRRQQASNNNAEPVEAMMIQRRVMNTVSMLLILSISSRLTSICFLLSSYLPSLKS